MPKSKHRVFPDFSKIGVDKAINNMPRIAGTAALAFFRDRFRQKGWIDKGFEPWDQRKAGGRGSLLHVTGDLKDSMRLDVSSGKAIISSDTTTTKNPKGYSKIHNEGGVIHIKITKKMRAFGWAMYKKTGDGMWKAIALTKKDSIRFRMPKRKFMGHSEFFMKRIEMNFWHEIDNVMAKEFKKR